MHKQKEEIFPKKTKIIMELTFYFPDNRIRDTHNGFKIPLDAMEKIVYDNDYWVIPRIIDFIIDKENPRLDITMYIKE